MAMNRAPRAKAALTGWRRHVAATPIGSVPVAYKMRSGPVLAYRVFFGAPADLVKAFEIASPDEEFWPPWMHQSARDIRKALAQEQRKASAKAAASKRYLGPSRKQDIGK